MAEVTQVVPSQREIENSEGPDWLYKGRVPGLDGLRGIAILLVLLAHASHTRHFAAPGFVLDLAHFGLGVDSFLMTSGFLITLLFMRELSRTDSIDVLHFYRRRVYRLFPTYSAFVLTILWLNHVSYLHLTPRDWRGLLTQSVNFVYHPTWEIGHLWSLSMQEQFYVAFPLVLAWLGPIRTRKALFGCLALAPVLRVTILLFFKAQSKMIDSWTPTRADTIVVGCLLALLAFDPQFRAWACLTGRKAMIAGVGALAVLTATCGLSLRFALYYCLMGYSIKAVSLIMLVWVCILNVKGRLGRLLKSPVLVALGAACYSIYLWQQLFFVPNSPRWFCQWPVNLVFVGVCAFCSYYFIERPLMAAKKKKAHPLSARQTPVDLERPVPLPAIEPGATA
jgi:peptidoglycan/LPS O-acetylase OafA/YrhL